MAQPPPVSPLDPTERLVGQSPAIHALRTQIRHFAVFDTVGNPEVPTACSRGRPGPERASWRGSSMRAARAPGPVHRGQLCCDPGHPAGGRAVRLRGGGLQRGQTR